MTSTTKNGRGNPAPTIPLHDIYLLDTQTGGRFKPIRQLGQGAMGSVWLVRDTVLRVDRAVKILKFNIARSKNLCSRFLREARAMAALKHPHIVTIYDFGQVKAMTPEGEILIPYIVMEFIEGGSLEDYFERVKGHLPPRFAINQVMRPMLSALGYIHVKEIFHRDIKPANFMIDGGVIKLGDFGIAHAEIEGFTQGLTTDRDTLGTLLYMAPEQFKESAKADARSDLYSAGMILWEMLHGEKPILPLVGTRLAQDDQLLERVPEMLRPVLCHAVRAKPEDRFATAQDFLQALEEVLPLLPEDPSNVLPLQVSLTKKEDSSGEQNVKEDSLTANPTLVVPEYFLSVEEGPEKRTLSEFLTMTEKRANRSLHFRRGILAGTIIFILIIAGISWQLSSHRREVFSEPVTVVAQEPTVVPVSNPVIEVPVSDPLPVVSSVVKTEKKEKTKDIKQTAPVVKVEIPSPPSQPSTKVVVNVSGDAKGVWLTTGGVSYALPGEVLPGTYTIEAQFDSERMPVGSVTVTDGTPVTIGCQSAFAKCKRK